MDMTRGITISTALHVLLVVMLAVGMPDWFKREQESQPLVITLENLPITDRTNIRPSDSAITRKDNTPAPMPVRKPTSKPKPPPPPPQEPEPVVAPPAKPKPSADPAPKPEPVTPEKAKPAPKKTPEPAPKQDASFEEVLKNLEKEAMESPSEESPKPKSEKEKDGAAQNLTTSQAPYDPTLPLSLSETDAITSQFIKCWRLPAGAANDYELRVSVDVSLRRDGSVIKAYLTSNQRQRYGADPVFRSAADGALRAVFKCSPIQNLPQEKYNSWKDMRLNFDPSMQLY